MKRRHRVLAACIMTVILCAGSMAGCQKKEEKKKLPKETFEFKDSSGNMQTAKLPALPKNKYDYSRIIEQNGYKYYLNKKGKVASKIGIDVSKYQKEVDWKEVKKSGIEFAMIRLGYRGYGEEGRMVLDEMYKSHIEGALSAGIDVGVYFFSQAVSDKEAKEEAKFVLKHIKKYDVTYPVVFDTEKVRDDEARTNEVDGKQFTKNCRIFCDKIEKAGYDTMIYANMSWFAFTLDLEKLQDYDKWYADYYEKPQFPYEFHMWQYTEKGVVPGIKGKVDLNIMLP